MNFFKNSATIWLGFVPVVILCANFFTLARFYHFLFSFIGCLITLMMTKSDLYSIHSKLRINKIYFYILLIFIIFLGSWLPDIDWLFKQHRSPFTHSIFPIFLSAFLIKRIKKVSVTNNDLDNLLLYIFSISLGTHLITDIAQYSNVIMIPAPFNNLFLGINGSLALLFGLVKIKRLKL